MTALADTAKSGELLQQLLGQDVPPPVYSLGFCGLLAAMCFGLRPAQLDQANTGLLAAVILSFAVCSLWHGLLAAHRADASPHLSACFWQHVSQDGQGRHS